MSITTTTSCPPVCLALMTEVKPQKRISLRRKLKETSSNEVLLLRKSITVGLQRTNPYTIYNISSRLDSVELEEKPRKATKLDKGKDRAQDKSQSP